MLQRVKLQFSNEFRSELRILQNGLDDNHCQNQDIKAYIAKMSSNIFYKFIHII